MDDNEKSIIGSKSSAEVADEEQIAAETGILDTTTTTTNSVAAIPSVEESDVGTQTPSAGATQELRKALYAEFFPQGVSSPEISGTPETQTGTIIRIKDLCKDYRVGWAQHRKFRALDGISLDVNAGEIFGFLGPNGAGKTTAIKVLLGITKPTSGTTEIFGETGATKAVRRHIGYFPEISYYHKYLTAREAITYYGRLCGLAHRHLNERVNRLLDTVGLTDHQNKLLKTFSKGMLQRIGLAQALINDPALLIMDEPTSGLDPLMKKEMRDLILYLNSEGRTILFSSHELSEVEMICHRVAILNKGKVIAGGALNEILPSQPGFIISVNSLPEDVENELRNAGIPVTAENGTATIQCRDNSTMHLALGRLGAAPCSLLEVRRQKQTLEDYFVSTVKGEGGVE